MHADLDYTLESWNPTTMQCYDTNCFLFFYELLTGTPKLVVLIYTKSPMLEKNKERRTRAPCQLATKTTGKRKNMFELWRGATKSLERERERERAAIASSESDLEPGPYVISIGLLWLSQPLSTPAFRNPTPSFSPSSSFCFLFPHSVSHPSETQHLHVCLCFQLSSGWMILHFIAGVPGPCRSSNVV